MSRMKRFAAALLLTAVIIADAVGFGAVSNGQAASQAGIYPFDLVSGHKVYDQNGIFKGCEVGGSGCVMVVFSAATMTISSEGVDLQ
jgi:hypothetical protein